MVDKLNEEKMINIKELNIYERMSLITDEIGIIEKNLKVQVTKTSSYNAVSERDILDRVKPIEKKYRVYSYPVKREIVDNDILIKETDYGKTNTLYLRLKTTYRFINLDNIEQFVDIDTYADGLDTGDKATGKAMTYSDKYALMKAYKISTGDDPDKEASPQTGYYKEKTSLNANQLIDDTKEKALRATIKRVGMSDERVLEILNTYGYKKLNEITLGNFPSIVKKFEKGV